MYRCSSADYHYYYYYYYYYYCSIHGGRPLTVLAIDMMPLSVLGLFVYVSTRWMGGISSVQCWYGSSYVYRLWRSQLPS